MNVFCGHETGTHSTVVVYGSDVFTSQNFINMLPVFELQLADDLLHLVYLCV